MGQTGSITYLEAIRSALRDALREDDRVFLLGRGHRRLRRRVRRHRRPPGEFGESRVIDTPIAEEGFVGAAIGAAWMGERPVVELQFADFITCAFDPIVTVAAKTHWRSGQQIPITIRCPTGGGVRGGPFHAGSPEGWFVGTAGLKIVCPASVEDAYGLLRAAIDDPDPVLYFEHKRLYRTLRAEAPPSRLPHPDRAGVDRARRARTRRSSPTAPASRPPSQPRTWSTPTSRWSTCARSGPSTSEAILASVEKTSRVLVLQEASRSTGAAGRDPLPDRPPVVRAPRRTARPARAARHAGAVRARARGRLPAVGRLDRRRPRRAARLLMRDRAVRRVTVGRAPTTAWRCSGSSCCSASSRTGCWRCTARAGFRARSTRAAARRRSQPAPASRSARTTSSRRSTASSPATSPAARPPPTCSATSSARRRARRFGRDGNMHFGAPANGVFPLVSMLGDLVPVVAGRSARVQAAAASAASR